MPLNMVPANKGIQGYADSMDVLTFLDGEWIRAGIVAWGGRNGGEPASAWTSRVGAAQS